MRPAGFVALLASIVAGPTLAQLEAREEMPSDVYSRKSELFAVDGQRRLNLFCVGDGTPAIVFVAGAWDNTMSWRRVHGPASRLSRACSYDRAGLGFSDQMMSQNAPVEGEYSLNEVQFREAIGNDGFGKLPLVLLRRGNRAKHPALPQEIFDRNESIALAGYERMAAYSSLGKVRTIPNSGHHIQLDQPEAVLAAIEEIVAAIRSAPTPRSFQ
jgi:pimeloyl-ACP methyl ester carboxylesterase